MKPNKPDQSGNPTGRPKGSRSKVPEAFITAMNDDFAKHGVGIIEKVRTEKPAAQDRRLARSEGHQHHSSLRPTGALVRQDLAAGRDRTTDGRLLRATPKLEKPRRKFGAFCWTIFDNQVGDQFDSNFRKWLKPNSAAAVDFDC